MPTPLSELLRQTRESQGSAALDVPSDWLQGRSVFGGLQAILALRAMRTLVPEVPLRSLQTTFVAPVPGGTVSAVAKILRTGKSATQVEARIVDGDATLAVAIGLFGAARASTVAVEPEAFTPPSATGDTFPFIEGLTPNFTQHFDAAWLEGAFPFTGSNATHHVLRVGMHDEGNATEEHIVAMADFIPPLGLSHLTTPAPGSTATWMLEFVGGGTFPLRGWHLEADLAFARDGYTSQSVTLSAPTGAPIVLSRQCMLVFG